MTPKEFRKKFQGKYLRDKIITDLTMYLHIQKIDIDRSNSDHVYINLNYFYYNMLTKECAVYREITWAPYYDVLDKYYVRITKNEYCSLLGRKNESQGNQKENSR